MSDISLDAQNQFYMDRQQDEMHHPKGVSNE